MYPSLTIHMSYIVYVPFSYHTHALYCLCVLHLPYTCVIMFMCPSLTMHMSYIVYVSFTYHTHVLYCLCVLHSPCTCTCVILLRCLCAKSSHHQSPSSSSEAILMVSMYVLVGFIQIRGTLPHFGSYCSCWRSSP